MTTTATQQSPVDRLAANRLLPLPTLTEAMTAGQMALAACTVDRPPMARGVHVWGTIIEALRRLGRADGWTRSEGKLSSVLSPDETVQITVATGDEATGVEGATPRTKYPRGAASVEAIEDNQIALFPEARPARRRTSGVLTWLLLHRRVRDCVRWELSLPKSVDEDGIIQTWVDRIILDPLACDLVDDAILSSTEDLDLAARRFDPEVTRK